MRSRRTVLFAALLGIAAARAGPVRAEEGAREAPPATGTERVRPGSPRPALEPMAARRVPDGGSGDVPPTCELPAASAEARVVVVSVHEAQALSSVAIGTQDRTVGAGSIVIERGDEPLWIAVISGEPTIWRFTGDVARVERAVIVSATADETGRATLAGAVGLSADVVTFPPACLRHFSEVKSTVAARTLASVREATHREPSIVTAVRVSEVVVPAGTIRVLPKGDRTIVRFPGAEDRKALDAKIAGGHDPVLASTFRWFRPGGLVAFDPAAVVAGARPVAYEVAPESAGLLQLAERGAIVRNRSGEYVIRKKIRMPAGLTGGHSVRFLLVRGVPIPDGDRGHSCVISEETGRSIMEGDRYCR